jgi:Spy/CpxP family protein refolding chaperone
MPYTKILAAVLALGVTGVGVAGFGAYRAYAHGGFRGHGGHHAMFLKFVDFAVNEKLDEIQATPAQRQKVQELKERLVAQGKAIHDEKADTHEQLLALLSQDDLDEAKLRGLVKERTEAISKFGDTVADAVIELHQTLTPEQRQKLLAEMREHMAEHGR